MAPQPAPSTKPKSTGPRTASGKSKSSKNALLHGLASGTLIMPGEDASAYAALEQSLLDQFQPQNPVETILVTNMAKHHWLSQRAGRLQAEVLSPKYRNRGDVPPSLAVLCRYQNSNDRAFHKCLETLKAMRKEQLAAENQFVSQPAFSNLSPAPPQPVSWQELLASYSQPNLPPDPNRPPDSPAR